MAALAKLDGRVLVVGDVMEDIIVLPEAAMVRGSDVRAKVRNMPGGSGANQAMWLGSMHVPVSFLARVGAGDVESFRARFVESGVTPLLVGDDELPTGRLVTLVDVDGERSFFTDRAANTRLAVSDCPEEILEGVGLVHFSGYAFFEPGPRSVALELMERARRADIPVSIDPASTGFLREVGARQFLDWTRGASFCFPNAEEAAFLSGVDDVENQIRVLGAHYDLVVIKRGAEGAVAGDARGIRCEVGAVRIDVVDTTGAGDAFLAGFVAEMAKGSELEQCLVQANAAGARAAAHMGGQPE